MRKILGRVAAALEKRRRCSAVIVASGSGERFGGVKKQFISIGGVPVIKRVAMAFEASSLIDEIIVVTCAEDVDYCRQLLEGEISKLTHVTAGGKTRQKSAMAGLELMDPASEFIAIHDGARCLVTVEMIEKVLREAFKTGAAAAAERAVDTVKYAESDGIIKETIDRDHVWLMKTPQVFLADMYRAGVYSAEKDEVSVTDDCMLVERLGFKVKAVDCGRENMKLTYPEDRVIAEAILRARSDAEMRGDGD